MTDKRSIGIGQYHENMILKNEMSILRVLSDGKEHRNKELEKESELKHPTYLNNRNNLIKIGLIEKRIVERKETQEYPAPVYYSLTSTAKPIVKLILQIEQEQQEIEKIISDPKKTLLDVLFQINSKNNEMILHSLKGYKENKNLSQEFINVLLKFFVWIPYIKLTSSLIESSKKLIDSIDIDKLIQQNKEMIYLDKDSLAILGLSELEIDKIIKKLNLRELKEE